jgi:hypothetical protein
VTPVRPRATREPEGAQRSGRGPGERGGELAGALPVHRARRRRLVRRQPRWRWHGHVGGTWTLAPAWGGRPPSGQRASRSLHPAPGGTDALPMLNRTTLGTTLTIAALAIGAPTAFAAPYTEDGKTVCNEAAWSRRAAPSTRSTGTRSRTPPASSATCTRTARGRRSHQRRRQVARARAVPGDRHPDRRRRRDGDGDGTGGNT